MNYKVIRNIDGRLVSSHQFITIAGITYKVGEWVKAPKELDALGYGPMVFDDYNLAVDFMVRFQDELCIYECKIKGIRKKKPLVPWYSCQTAYMDRFIKALRHASTCGPKGTKMVGAVKLTKLLDPEHHVL